MNKLAWAPLAAALLASVAFGQGAGLPTTPPEGGWTTEDARREPRTPVLGYFVATVVRISVLPKNNRFIVTLDNGQRWRQIENKENVKLEIGDEIKVQKSTMNAYRLTTKDGVETTVKRDR